MKELKGYKAKRLNGTPAYSWKKSLKIYKRTGYFRTKINGSGHTAGYNWGSAKKIDPKSQIRRYGKNSPSFDEGVYKYKQEARHKALQNKMK